MRDRPSSWCILCVACAYALYTPAPHMHNVLYVRCVFWFWLLASLQSSFYSERTRSPNKNTRIAHQTYHFTINYQVTNNNNHKHYLFIYIEMHNLQLFAAMSCFLFAEGRACTLSQLLCKCFLLYGKMPILSWEILYIVHRPIYCTVMFLFSGSSSYSRRISSKNRILFVSLAQRLRREAQRFLPTIPIDYSFYTRQFNIYICMVNIKEGDRGAKIGTFCPVHFFSRSW